VSNGVDFSGCGLTWRGAESGLDQGTRGRCAIRHVQRSTGVRVQFHQGTSLPSSYVVCNPHSVLLVPGQRPARGSSSSDTGRVVGLQPMEEELAFLKG
jgi:hypothetical protein